ncbi:MAG: hypothetical protein AVDCRST_MAG50-336 [uncultured Acidimicrobiales bacterium]|uniref:MaoC-like domain-containing protein n=1 Tax=uncultured Acidimicrobiales bacterium TaxID=310071 RepID=A0A6J4H3I0_9ACTN|nr:MAG: hypothetical protein AVDCRST_MAG50-336 [uncultured Acidimicrobiales bacterium]
MAPFETRKLMAHNTATTSQNKIHDDDVAKRFGFTGGLVPGVDVYAYLSQPVAAAWGTDWLERGSLQGRFVKPVYEGEEIEVVPGPEVEDDGGRTVSLEIRNPAGERCAEGSARLSATAPAGVDISAWPEVVQAAEPPAASPASLAVGTAFGFADVGFHADEAMSYLDDVRDPLPLYREERVAHPGWLLRLANRVLATNVRLGPWIHVGSDTQHLGLLRDGERVGARSLVTREWEKGGHRFVELDVLLARFSGDGGPIARIAHTAIYQPRGA